jgi:hypothetical protein
LYPSDEIPFYERSASEHTLVKKKVAGGDETKIQNNAGRMGLFRWCEEWGTGVGIG